VAGIERRGGGRAKGRRNGGEERGNACHKNSGFCIMLTDLLVIRSRLPSINCHAFTNQNVELAPCGLQERKNGNKPKSTFTERMKTISRFLKTSKFVDRRKNTFAENKQRFRGENEERDLSAYLEEVSTVSYVNKTSFFFHFHRDYENNWNFYKQIERPSL